MVEEKFCCWLLFFWCHFRFTEKKNEFNLFFFFLNFYLFIFILFELKKKISYWVWKFRFTKNGIPNLNGYFYFFLLNSIYIFCLRKNIFMRNCSFYIYICIYDSRIRKINKNLMKCENFHWKVIFTIRWHHCSVVHILRVYSRKFWPFSQT